MAFCSFTKEAVKNLSTNIDNYFLTEFLPEADGDALKVYLYGLYLCKNFEGELSVAEFAEKLFMSEELVKDLFKYWEDFDVVTIISEEPFTVKYLPLTFLGKPRKYKSGKYDDFSKSVQMLVSERMIPVNEYAEYFSIMEDFNVSQEAMLMIVKYCVDLEGAKINGRYIAAVAKDFAMRGITTAYGLEAELADYNLKIDDVQKILSAMGQKRKADIEDFNFYSKWTSEMDFSPKAVIFAAKKFKTKSTVHLDKVMTELYGAKKFSQKEIDDYFDTKEQTAELAKNVLRALSVYVEVLSPVIDNYINPWLSLGYEPDTLVFIAGYCFKKRHRSLEGMDDTVKSLYKKGLITLTAIGDYAKNRAIEDEFIKKILSSCATDRLPNDWDRQVLATWREWGFDDDMILRAAAISAGKTAPLLYMNTVLSNWKNSGVKTVEQADALTNFKTIEKSSATANERRYTKEQLNELITQIEDVEL